MNVTSLFLFFLMWLLEMLKLLMWLVKKKAIILGLTQVKITSTHTVLGRAFWGFLHIH